MRRRKLALCTLSCYAIYRAILVVYRALAQRLIKAQSYVEHAVYINLPNRLDRRSQVEYELRRAHIAFERIEGVKVRKFDPEAAACWDDGDAQCLGQLGCQRSHLKALKWAESHRWKEIAIFEDDFTWLPNVDPAYAHHVLEKIRGHLKDWDVIALGLRLLKTEELDPKVIVSIGPQVKARVVRIVSAATTHAYVVNGAYITQLYNAFSACNVTKNYDTAIDTCWFELQKSGKWYGIKPQMGTQRKGFSDIEHKYIDLEAFISTNEG